MRQDKLSKQNVILYLCGIIPVVWLGLLIAPCLKDGLPGLVQQFGSVMQNPFQIQLCEDSVKTVLTLLLVYGIAIGVYLSTEHNYRRREEHGSAKWGTAGSVNKKYANKDKTENKLLIGARMNSLAIMADAFNNLSDAASSVISFVGVKMANKPADKEHPFGHGRIEYIAALIVSFLVIEVGFTFLKSSLEKIRNPEEITFQMVPFLILVLSVGVKLWMALFNRKLGNRIQSKVMLATSADSMGDVITTSATIASTLICHFLSVNIDAIAGLVVAVLVMWSGISIAKDTLEPLIGQGADPDLYARIMKEVASYEGIVGTHDLIVHNYGPGRSMASIHAEVPRDVDIEVSHDIIDRIEHEVGEKLGILLVIHMDPVEIHDATVLATKEKVRNVISILDPELSFHDFRMINGSEKKKLIFDLEIPYSYKKKDCDRVIGQIGALMKEMDEKYECVVNIDKKYVAGE